ncbi:hypothetical protein [Endozoicomonas ascidiicola]|uniref:hypothetical protein n=1 Tax=Endozoicomonas ascidiicola TaxID=1698521 RepID=UPI000833B155|nr:hypothetical protein [Endozoicomonas ascidiicola]
MKTASARLSIDVFVDCPHCDRQINLMDTDDTNGYNHNEEGYVISQACPDGAWIDEHDKFEVEEVTCSECEKTFDVKGLGW